MEVIKVPKITIKNFGPIELCEMNIDNLTILTGAQASGKSTIAKCIYFFRTIKDDIYDVIMKKSYLGSNITMPKLVSRVLRNKFLQMFGTSRAMDSNMCLRYDYTEDTFIQVRLELKKGVDYISPNYIMIDFSENINVFLRTCVGRFDESNVRREINNIFNDEYETIFIPAGRSLISLLTSQLNYMLVTMDDEQKRSIDYCTQKYMERILKIRPLFSEGIDGLVNQKTEYSRDYVNAMRTLINQVLKGKYFFVSGEERLYLPANSNKGEERFVKINFTSSGQQETVWIFNILFHLLINGTKSFIILEEPEAHLYPDAQKSITDALALMLNSGSNMMITTHSPYILGEFNNLIYANFLFNKSSCSKGEITNIVDKKYYVDKYNAFFVSNGKIKPCVENTDEKLIMNEVIDGASSDINNVYDRLFDLEN